MAIECVEDIRAKDRDLALALHAPDFHAPVHQLLQALSRRLDEQLHQILIVEIESLADHIVEPVVQGIVLLAVADVQPAEGRAVAGDVGADIGAGQKGCAAAVCLAAADHQGLCATLRRADGRAQSAAAGAHDDDIVGCFKLLHSDQSSKRMVVSKSAAA